MEHGRWRLPLLLLITLIAAGGYFLWRSDRTDTPQLRELREPGFLVVVDQADRIENLVDRCQAYPPPEGAKWGEDLVEALCLDSGVSVAKADWVKAQIDSGDFEALSRHYQKLIDRHYSGKDPEKVLYRAFPRVSWAGFEEYDQYSGKWLESQPHSAPALLLRARYLGDRAWEARGNLPVAEVPEERMAAAVEYARQGVELAERARAAQPRLLPAYVEIIQLSALLGDQRRLHQALEAALAQSPASYYVRTAALGLVEPKWGGSREAMARLVDDALEHRVQNPRLSMLALRLDAEQAGELSERKTYGPALDAYAAVLARGPDPGLFQSAAYAAHKTGNYAKSVQYVNQMLRFDRWRSDDLLWRGDLLASMNYPERALRDYSEAARLAPANPEPQFRSGKVFHGRQQFDAAVAAYRRSLAIDPDHIGALRHICRLLVHLSLKPRQAKPFAERLVKLLPEDAEAWLLLANVHHSLGDPAVYESAPRFLQLADPEKAEFKGPILQITRFLSEHPAPTGSRQ